RFDENAGMIVPITGTILVVLGTHIYQSPATIGTVLHSIFTICRRIAIIFLDNTNSAKDEAVYHGPEPAGQIPDSYPDHRR
ncbi:MAG: hypothetical protein VYE19_05265, partial [Chloroflexota bacterium]|nr:hypothetical protein [Chloroflexota bacterium]